jgi:hypothetical protein
MTTLAVELTFPSAPITSLLKRIGKGIEEFYYAKLFLSSKAYDGPEIWRGWLELGFHVAIYSPPPGVSVADRIRIRTKAPSRSPVLSAEAHNTDALKDLESVLQLVDEIRPSLAGKPQDARASAFDDSDFGGQLVAPVVETLKRHTLEASEIDEFRAMLRRGFDAITNDELQSMTLTLS